MKNLISREAAIKAFTGKPPEYYHTDYIASELRSLPAIESVPVVKCRDCKHRPTDYRNVSGDCTGFDIEFPDDRCPCKCEDGWYNWYPADDWFCGNGERRDEDE